MNKVEQKRGNIQRKVVASILLVGTIPGILVVILTYLSGINALKNSIGTNFQEMAKETADKVEIIMNGEIQDAQSLALSPYIKSAILKANLIYEGKNETELKKHQTEIEQRCTLARKDDVSASEFLNRDIADYLKEYMRQRMIEYGSILVTDKKGAIIAATDKPMDYYQSGKGWWDITFNHDKGNAIGGLKMVHDVNDIFKVITNIKIGETGHANLVTSDGTLVICPIFPPKSHTINNQLMGQISLGKTGWGIALDDAHGGRNSIIGFAPVTSTFRLGKDNFGGKEWHIFIRQLPDETYAPMHALLWKVSFLGLGLIIVLSSLGFYVARKIVRPISVLSEGAELIGRGYLNHRISINTNDEIEQLAETFNQMADNLEKSGRERERYLNQIKESEEQYKTLFNYAEDSML